jgi:uncharacterized membrane protein YraQ (UPF0718 family)
LLILNRRSMVVKTMLEHGPSLPALDEQASALNRVKKLLRANQAEAKVLLTLLTVFLAVFFMPIGTPRFDDAVLEGLYLVHWYAREHVVLCLLPAFLIAGAIAVFISQQAVMKYLGPTAPKVASFGVASVSGSILAVCSCTVLPLFGGIYRRGAGLGPAIAFLYSGPAINVLAIVITAKVLGAEMGIARAVGAIGFAVVIGALMHVLYRREEVTRVTAKRAGFQVMAEAGRPLGEVTIFFTLLFGILVFANWAPAAAEDSWLWHAIYSVKWSVAAAFAASLVLFLVARWRWPVFWVGAVAAVVGVLAWLFPQTPQLSFAVGIIGLATLAALQPGEGVDWFNQSWEFAKQILPLLLGGVLIAGFLLGRPGHEGVFPVEWVTAAVGGNSVLANFLAALVGAFMYFATLTEVPIVQGLMNAGMGKGPALALLLAGPALSLPSMLAIRRILGTQKTAVYMVLVVVMATITGVVYGTFWP